MVIMVARLPPKISRNNTSIMIQVKRDTQSDLETESQSEK